MGLGAFCLNNIFKEINKICCKTSFTEMFIGPKANVNSFTPLKSKHIVLRICSLIFIGLKE